MMRGQRLLVAGSSLAALLQAAGVAAQVLPGPADVSQTRPAERQRILATEPESVPATQAASMPQVEAPAQAKTISVRLERIRFEGVTVFSEEELLALYATHRGKQVPLSTLWEVANALTQKYRAEGYFLSRAFVPAQEAEGGMFTIRAVEGYIGKVVNKGIPMRKDVLDTAVQALKAQRPITLAQLESQVLLLNDLPGLQVKTLLAPLPDAEDGAVQLQLDIVRESASGSVSLDNTGSRYIGPYQLSANMEYSLAPLHNTIATVVTAPFDDELYGANVLHQMSLGLRTSLELMGGYTKAKPGYILEPQEIETKSFDAAIGVRHQFIRQREENLSTKVSFAMRNTFSDILSSSLTKDKTRALHFDMNYDRQDNWMGRNYVGLTMHKGVAGFGANDADDFFISRLNAKPDFFKVQGTYTRVQSLPRSWSGILTLAGQKASGSLYSSEEFGYGGSALGRAYDVSEITGDDGAAGSVELRYQGVPEWQNIYLTPFLFYDVGKVWNDNPDQVAAISASSAGAGMYFSHSSGLSGTIYAAQPLTKSIDAPLYGGNGENPRYMFQFGYKF